MIIGPYWRFPFFTWNGILTLAVNGCLAAIVSARSWALAGAQPGVGFGINSSQAFVVSAPLAFGMMMLLRPDLLGNRRAHRPPPSSVSALAWGFIVVGLFADFTAARKHLRVTAQSITQQDALALRPQIIPVKNIERIWLAPFWIPQKTGGAHLSNYPGVYVASKDANWAPDSDFDMKAAEHRQLADLISRNSGISIVDGRPGPRPTVWEIYAGLLWAIAGLGIALLIAGLFTEVEKRMGTSRRPE